MRRDSLKNESDEFHYLIMMVQGKRISLPDAALRRGRRSHRSHMYSALISHLHLEISQYFSVYC